MQVLCGQCGTLIDVDDGIDAESIECIQCEREILFDTDSAAAKMQEEPGFADVIRSAMPGKLDVHCDTCGKHFTVTARNAGRRGKCPVCQSSLRIPYPDEQDVRKSEHRRIKGKLQRSETRSKKHPPRSSQEIIRELRRHRRRRQFTALAITVALLAVAIGASAYFVVPKLRNGSASEKTEKTDSQKSASAPPAVNTLNRNANKKEQNRTAPKW